ncbi:hypothetical protein KR100_12940 [Synechococcus sp. KORDI-100]|nr:hypothetical protein KR100_12940 [Synechococcus sp. KORDI-100]
MSADAPEETAPASPAGDLTEEDIATFPQFRKFQAFQQMQAAGLL